MASTKPWVPWALLFASLASLTLQETSQLSCTSQNRYLRIPGDAYVTVFLDIHYPDPSRPWRCGTGVNKRAVIDLEAMIWAVDKIRSSGYYGNGVLGLEVYDTCGLKTDALQFARDKMSSLYDCSACSENGTFLGLIGPSNCDAADAVANLMMLSNVTHVLTSQCSRQYVTNDVTSYTNVFRMLERRRTRNKALLALVKEFEWTYIGAVHDGTKESIEDFQEFKDLANRNGICILHTESVTAALDMDNLAAWADEDHFSLSSTTGTVGVVYFGDNKALVDLFTEIENRNLNDYLEKLQWVLSTDHFSAKELSDVQSYGGGAAILVSSTSFRLQEVTDFIYKRINSVGPVTPRNRWVKNLTTLDVIISETVVPSLDAIYMYAKSLKEVVSSLCPANSGFICDKVDHSSIRERYELTRVSYSALSNMAPDDFVTAHRNISLDKDKSLQSIMDGSQSPRSLQYILFPRTSSQSPQVIGNFSESAGLQLDKTVITIPPSICKSSCPKCMTQVMQNHDFFIKEGDVYFLALMKLHNRPNDPSDRYGCGGYDETSDPYLQMEALLFALEKMSNETGINFGVIAYDGCDSSVRLTNMLGNFFNNNTGDPHFSLTVGGSPLDKSQVVGVIGAFTSTDTLAAAAFLTHVRRILISYAASSTLLDDKNRFPYFLRTIPSDSKQARAMVDIIKHLGANYVHLVHVDNDYGRTGAAAFKDIAQQHGICLSRPDPMALGADDVKGQADALQIAGQLISYKDARIVVFFGEDDHAIKLLTQLKKVTSRQFVFILSEAVADGEGKIRRLFPDLILGSISLAVDTKHMWHESFYNYVWEKRPNFAENPIWFDEFWQNNFRCSLRDSFSKKYPLCTGNERISEETVRVGNPWIPPIITATLALAKGLSQTTCPDLSKCPVEQIVQSVAGTTLTPEQASRPLTLTPEQSSRPFDADRNGYVGYKVYNFQKNASGTIFKEVGSISPNGSLVGLQGIVFYDVNGDVISDLKSTCRGAVEGCNTCDVDEVEDEGHEGVIIALILVCVICIVAFVAMFLYMRYKDDNCQVIARSCLVIHRPTVTKQNGVLHSETPVQTPEQTPIQTSTPDDVDVDSIYTTPISDNFNRLGLFFGPMSGSVDGSTRSANSDHATSTGGPPLPRRNGEALGGGRGRSSTLPTRSLSLPPKAMRPSTDESDVESEPAYLQMNRSEPGFPISRKRPASHDPLSGLATLPRNTRDKGFLRSAPERDSLEMYRYSDSVHYHSSPVIDEPSPVSPQQSRLSDSGQVKYSTLSNPSSTEYSSLGGGTNKGRPSALYYPSSDRHHTSGESGSSGRLSPFFCKPQVDNEQKPSHYDPYPYSYINKAYSPGYEDGDNKTVDSTIQYENPSPSLHRHLPVFTPNWGQHQTDGLRSKYV